MMSASFIKHVAARGSAPDVATTGQALVPVTPRTVGHEETPLTDEPGLSRWAPSVDLEVVEGHGVLPTLRLRGRRVICLTRKAQLFIGADGVRNMRDRGPPIRRRRTSHTRRGTRNAL